MSKFDPSEYSLETRAIRAGINRTHEGEHAEPLFLTSSFVFGSAREAAARFAGANSGNIYSRFTNPTVNVFEQRLATLENGERCVATASGMSAILNTCLALLKSGNHIVSSSSIFGTTIGLFDRVLLKLGIYTSYVPLTDYAAWQDAIKPNTKMLFLETPSNPLTEIADIARLAEIAHRHRILLVVDNCFCTPMMQQPLALGADIVVHSATKYLDGQGRCVGGAVIGSEALLGEEVFALLRTGGASMSPFNAWVFLKGLETLKTRLQQHCKNAQQIAEWLQHQSQVEQVYYPGLQDHPQHALAKAQQNGFGGIVSFVVLGGQQAAWELIDATRLISITANLGDTKSTITHPATTTHHRLTDSQRHAAGITAGLVRLSVGLEDVADLIADLQTGIDQIKR